MFGEPTFSLWRGAIVWKTLSLFCLHVPAFRSKLVLATPPSSANKTVFKVYRSGNRTGKPLVSECRTAHIVRHWSKRQASLVQFIINASLRMHATVVFSADMDLSESFDRGLQALSSANITWAVLIYICVIVVETSILCCRHRRIFSKNSGSRNGSSVCFLYSRSAFVSLS